MNLIQAKDIRLSFGEKNVLNGISFTLALGKKMGIVGVNGCGKTSLLKIITHQYMPHSGEVQYAKDLKLGFLEQEAVFQDETIYSATMMSYAYLIQKEADLKAYAEEMEKNKDNSKKDAFIKLYYDTLTEFEEKGGFSIQSYVKGILKGLGFNEEDFERKAITLSPGQRTRLLMARLLASDPDVLVLDEPTNHLDVEALTWLEMFLQSMKKSLIVVSHDRTFLDKICNEILEIEEGEMRVYEGNYSSFLQKKERDLENLERAYLKQKKEIANMEAIIEKQRQWNRERNIIAAESRMKAIERMDKIQQPKRLKQSFIMNFEEADSATKEVLCVKNLAIGYGGQCLAENISLTIFKKERIFLVGPNGCGKTTFLKTLNNETPPIRGSIHLGAKTKIGYADQDFKALDPNQTIFDVVSPSNRAIPQTQIRNTLALLGFKGEEVFKKIFMLSGGEKNRVALAKLVLSENNVLFLDEPTNHLDIQTREVLEEALNQFEGTLICISHDRTFISKLANGFLFFEDGVIKRYQGTYANFQDWLKNRKKMNEVIEKQEIVTEGKKQFLVQKEQKAIAKKREAQMREIEKNIGVAEKRLQIIDQELHNEQRSTDFKFLEELMNEKDLLEEELLKLYEMQSENLS